jgi:hypothetical protein
MSFERLSLNQLKYILLNRFEYRINDWEIRQLSTNGWLELDDFNDFILTITYDQYYYIELTTLNDLAGDYGENSFSDDETEMSEEDEY